MLKKKLWIVLGLFVVVYVVLICSSVTPLQVEPTQLALDCPDVLLRDDGRQLVIKAHDLKTQALKTEALKTEALKTQDLQFLFDIDATLIAKMLDYKHGYEVFDRFEVSDVTLTPDGVARTSLYVAYGGVKSGENVSTLSAKEDAFLAKHGFKADNRNYAVDGAGDRPLFRSFEARATGHQVVPSAESLKGFTEIDRFRFGYCDNWLRKPLAEDVKQEHQRLNEQYILPWNRFVDALRYPLYVILIVFF